MKTNVSLHITFSPERWSQVCQATIPAHYEGFSPSICYGGNTALAGEQIRFDGNSRQDVINSVIAELHSRNLHGSLKVIDG